ncbi:MAG: ATP-grasp domain-containing protein [Chloracidobacterium sp.]|nr:ATP-grasp domain-containing protein [Chloracidobacterium sp.]MCO5334709.1 ATP-grasp domain-containing protein [Pyrinomonadaceae bacterium]
MAKHIVIIASDFKGVEFIEECHYAGWHVTLVTRRKLFDSPWPWTAINDTKMVDDEALPVDYVRAATNVCGEHAVDKVVGLDEFDVITAAMTREHLQIPGLTSSYLRRFRDKLSMRNLAANSGIPCPEYIGVFNSSEIADFLEKVPAPWIVKPRHEVSAFGIRKCTTSGEVWDVLNELDARNTWRDHPSQFLIERFVEGRVYHVDSVVDKGKVVAAGVSQYGTTPFNVSHHGGVFTSFIVPYRAKERKELETLNRALLMAFEYERGVSHAEFLQSSETGEFFLLEVACRVGGAYIANVLEIACNFNLWREWAKLEIADADHPYKLPKQRRDFAGVALALANTEWPDTSHYTDEEIAYRITKERHVGMIFHSTKAKRIEELLEQYSQRIGEDFLEIAPVKERHDD